MLELQFLNIRQKRNRFLSIFLHFHIAVFWSPILPEGIKNNWFLKFCIAMIHALFVAFWIMIIVVNFLVSFNPFKIYVRLMRFLGLIFRIVLYLLFTKENFSTLMYNILVHLLSIVSRGWVTHLSIVWPRFSLQTASGITWFNIIHILKFW